MKAPRTKLKSRRFYRRVAGTTFVETIIGLTLFALVSVGVTGSAIKQMRESESIMNQTLAQSMAQGLMEQIRRAGFTALSDMTAATAIVPDDYPTGNYETAVNAVGTTYTTYRKVDLVFIGVTADNFAEVQSFNLYWAGDTATYCEIGARSDPAVPTSTILGMLLDADYRNSAGVVLRARRYMHMKVNLTRTLNAKRDAVQITLRYQWAIPGKTTATGNPIYYPVREIRSVISQISSY